MKFTLTVLIYFMIREFDGLYASECELMLKAPLLVCILIAGADDDIDRREVKKAIELSQRNQSRGKSRLTEFYRELAEDFEDKLKIVIQSFPSKAIQREPMISAELKGLNDIFPKLNTQFAVDFYQSLLELAQKTAESSGGLLGMKSVGAEEAKLVTLAMILNPADNDSMPKK